MHWTQLQDVPISEGRSEDGERQHGFLISSIMKVLRKNRRELEG